MVFFNNITYNIKVANKFFYLKERNSFKLPKCCLNGWINKNMLKTLYKNKNMIFSLALSDFKKRFSGSYFGLTWMFIQPFVTVFIYFLVFQVGFRSIPPVDAPYILWFIPGIVPWFFFSEGIICGTNCLSEYSYLVKKMVFHVEFLPIIKMISCMMVHIIFILIMFLIFLLYGYAPSIIWLQIIYYSIATLVYASAIVYFTSSIYVFFRDISQFVTISLQIGMWLTPIMWAPQMLAGAPEWLEAVLKINPFYYIVAGFRDTLLTQNYFWQRPLNTIYFWAITIVLILQGFRLFAKLRPHFSDVL